MERINIPGLSPYYGLTTGFSKSFQNLIKDIGDARSKCEEDRIIEREIKYLKENIDKPNIESKQMKENLIRLIYCEMLGHDASFGFIHAIKYTQKGKLLEKRIGYLACCLLLDENHELTLLLMNALQKDLKSTNVMENCIALIAASRLVNKETIPTVLPLVVKLLQHKREMVRKKAVMVLLHFHVLDPSSITDIKSKFEDTLCDRNPGVMGTTLNVYLKLVSENPVEYKRLTGPFVNILKQVIEFRLPNEFTYYKVAAPWIQIKLFKILAFLGQDDKQQSETMYEILRQCIETAYIENNIGCAVLSECLYTAATIYPHRGLSEIAARRVGLLLVSNNNNLKYLGIKILAHLIKADVSYAFRHQMTVIDCLNDPDETLKRKTLVLLYRITNASNVSVICEKLINYLRSSVDDHLRTDLVDKITTLAEKYAPSNDWFIETMNEVFELGGSLVQPQVAHNIMRLIGEGTDDDELDTELRLYAVNSYLDLMEKPSLPDILVHLICWVIGEYSYLVTNYEPEVVMSKLCQLLDRQFNDKSTKNWVVTALTKIAGRLGYLPDSIHEIIEKQLKMSTNVELNHRCADLLAIFKVFDSFEEILPIDASCEDLEVDSTLSFLDGFVSEALANGAPPYLPKHLRQTEELKKPASETNKAKAGLNFVPYPKQERPKRVVSGRGFQTHLDHSPLEHSIQSPRTASFIDDIPVTEAESKHEHTVRKSAKKLWGPTGYMGEKTDEKPRKIRSDSSSSGSVSSGAVDESHKYTEATAPSWIGNLTEDTTRMKLAQQLFTMPSAQGGALMSEKAGFHGRKRPEKNSRMLPSVETTEDQQGKVQQAKALVSEKGTILRKEPGTLLLDLDESGVSENAVLERSDVPNMNIGFCPSNLSLLDATDMHNQQGSITNESMENVYIDQSTQDSMLNLQESSNQDQLLNPLFQQTLPETEVSLLDQDDEELIAPSLQNSMSSLINRSVPVIPEDLDGYPHSEMLLICEDSNVKLNCQKIQTPDSLILMIYTMNETPATLSDVNLLLRPPLNLSSILDNTTELSSKTEQIDGWQHHAHVLCMKFKSPSRHMVLDGQLSYRDSTDTQKRLFIKLSLSIFDFVRPLKITTNAYANKWENQGYERKKHIAAAKPFQSVLDIIETKFNFAIVQVIGNEAIAAATILGKDECLLHFNHVSNGNEFRLKTGSELLNECIMAEITKSFSG